MTLKLLNVPDTFVKIKKQNNNIFFLYFDHYHIRCATIESQCFAMKKKQPSTVVNSQTQTQKKKKKKRTRKRTQNV